jgi:hypothetical protein
MNEGGFGWWSKCHPKCQSDPASVVAPGGCSSLIRCHHLLLTSSPATLSHLPLPLLWSATIVLASALVCHHLLSAAAITNTNHHLATVALCHSSAGRCHQTVASCLLPKLSPHQILSAAVISSCLPPLHSLMADCQVFMCRPPPPKHPLSSAAKAVLALLLISSRPLLAGSARRAII